MAQTEQTRAPGAPAGRWTFAAAAGIPCALLLVFCGGAIREWWLVHSNQILVTPRPVPGINTVPNMSASEMLPLVAGSAVLAAMFGYAWARRSRTALLCAWLAVALVAALPWLRRLF